MEPKILLVEEISDFLEPYITVVIELPDADPDELTISRALADIGIESLSADGLQDFCEQWRFYAERNGLTFDFDRSLLAFADGHWSLAVVEAAS